MDIAAVLAAVRSQVALASYFTNADEVGKAERPLAIELAARIEALTDASQVAALLERVDVLRREGRISRSLAHSTRSVIACHPVVADRALAEAEADQMQEAIADELAEDGLVPTLGAMLEQKRTAGQVDDTSYRLLEASLRSTACAADGAPPKDEGEDEYIRWRIKLSAPFRHRGMAAWTDDDDQAAHEQFEAAFVLNPSPQNTVNFFMVPLKRATEPGSTASLEELRAAYRSLLQAGTADYVRSLRHLVDGDEHGPGDRDVMLLRGAM